MYSAMPPGVPIPGESGARASRDETCRHSLSRPETHSRHVPQFRTNATSAASPTCHPVTASPIWSITPDTSWTRVLPTRGLSSPMAMIERSEAHNPAPETLRRTSFAPTSGRSFLSTSTVLFRTYVTARMITPDFDALSIVIDLLLVFKVMRSQPCYRRHYVPGGRSEEHTSELQSRFDLVCRLLLEKKKYNTMIGI